MKRIDNFVMLEFVGSYDSRHEVVADTNNDDCLIPEPWSTKIYVVWEEVHHYCAKDADSNLSLTSDSDDKKTF